mgnify:CR=1 FL=1|jgi:ribosomal protein S18 acetylase RimI-like enzyme
MVNPSTEIFKVTEEKDIKEITAIHKECFGEVHWDKYQEAINDEKCFIIAGKQNGEIVSYLIAHVEGERATGLWQGTKESHRRQGIGKIVNKKVFEEASRRGAEYFDSFLTVENDMFEAISGLNKQLGFIPIAQYPDHYIKNGEKIDVTISHFRVSLMPLKK